MLAKKKTFFEYFPYLSFADKIRSLYQNNKDINPLLKSVLDFHFEKGGSFIRTQLTYDLSVSLGIPQDDALTLSLIPELLHNASLIHDDICDQDLIRRDRQTVWCKFGSDIALCGGDFLISLSYGCIAKLNTKHLAEIVKITHKSVEMTISGQISEAELDPNQTLDDLAVYNNICSKKTGALFILSGTLPFVFVNKKTHVSILENFLNKFSVIYQIQDDLQDKDLDQSKKGSRSALNILTVLEKRGDLFAAETAKKYAINEIEKLSSVLGMLPLPTQRVIQNLLNKTAAKLSNNG